MTKQHTQLDIVKSLITQLENNMNNQNHGMMKISIRSNNNSYIFLIRYFMPYCIEKLKNGNYIFLNRGYSPIGLTYETWNPLVNYEEYSNVSFSIKKLDRLYFYKQDKYFYSDECKPWDKKEYLIKYLNRLKLFIFNQE